MEKFIIYSAKNIFNSKIYIGATTKSIKERELNHIEKATLGETTKFYEAISTYGADAFNWEGIDTANTVDELAKKEKDYIIKYNSKEEGYNSDSGGGFKKTVYQYSLEDGILINNFDCLENAGNVINASKQQISRACLSVNKTFGGFYWSYDYKEPFGVAEDKRKKRVCQFSLDGMLLGEFCSISEASTQTGVNKSSIAKVCRGERKKAGGFVWSYK